MITWNNIFLQHLPKEFSDSPLVGFHLQQDLNLAFLTSHQSASSKHDDHQIILVWASCQFQPWFNDFCISAWVTCVGQQQADHCGAWGTIVSIISIHPHFYLSQILLLIIIARIDIIVPNDGMIMIVLWQNFLQPLSRRLRFLSLLGNQLRCDCKVSSYLSASAGAIKLWILTSKLLICSGFKAV